MSSVSEMFPPRNNVYVIENTQLHVIPYENIHEGDIYVIQLISGSYSIYRKTSLFDDELIQKVKTQEEVISLIKTHKN